MKKISREGFDMQQKSQELILEESAKELKNYLQSTIEQIKDQLKKSGYELSSLTLEISFKNSFLKTRGNQEAEESLWGSTINKVAQEVGIQELYFIDPYGSGLGATVSFELIPFDSERETVEANKFGLDGKATGHFKDAALDTEFLSLDIDGISAFKLVSPTDNIESN